MPNRKKNETELYAKSSSSELQTEKMSKKPLNTTSRYSTVQLIKKTDVITDNELYKISTPVFKKKRNVTYVVFGYCVLRTKSEYIPRSGVRKKKKKIRR